MKLWPFKVSAKGEKPSIQVKHKGDLKDFVSRNGVFSPLLRLI